MGWMKPNAKQPHNLLLRAMKSAIGSQTVISVQPISLDQGAVICEPGNAMGHIYFPLSCVLSAESGLRDGTVMATTLRGREGSFGLLTAIRKASAHTRCQVQVGGSALRLDAKQLGS